MLRKGFSILMVAGIAACLPLLAGTEGTEKATAKIQAAMEKHAEILSSVLERVPESARESIEQAQAAALQGQEKALAALATARGQAPAGVTASQAGGAGSRAGATAQPEANGGKPDVTGLMKARESVAAGFDKSVAALNAVIARVPDDAQARILAALERVEAHRQTALANLDLLIAGDRPGQTTATDRPDRPDRPARPERPDRPEVPDRPDRPAIPDRPERPEVPAPVN